MKDYIFFTLFGFGNSFIATNFEGSRFRKLCVLNRLLLSVKTRICPAVISVYFPGIFATLLRVSCCGSPGLLRILQCHPNKHLNPCIPVRTEFIRRWNGGGRILQLERHSTEFVIPVRCWECSFSFICSAIEIWWYPDIKSNVVKYLALPSWSSISVILGNGKESPIVTRAVWKVSDLNMKMTVFVNKSRGVYLRMH